MRDLEFEKLILQDTKAPWINSHVREAAPF